SPARPRWLRRGADPRGLRLGGPGELRPGPGPRPVHPGLRRAPGGRDFRGARGRRKTYLASALGHAACRVGHDVLFLRADHMLQGLHQARADHTTEKALRRLLAPDVLIVDDFGLRRLDARQSSDFYEVVLERHRRASTIVTSNRAIDEWIPLFDDPVLA